MRRIGMVVIGRNEGKRLKACLESVVGMDGIGRVELKAGNHVVYVDSGSTDGSAALARALGVEVVELDMSVPCSAARARNAGLARLCELAPEIEYVQFIDGDCILAADWMDAAYLDEHPDYAVICGRRRERFPEASIFNRLCDIEWNTPVGDAAACGGDALMRIAALKDAGGFDARIIAGEELELCLRLRQRGWSIRRLDREMTVHDAAMTHFGQWWKRAVRGGYGHAQVAVIHGGAADARWVRETRSLWFWGLAVPAVVLGLAWWTRGMSLMVLLGYPALAVRVWGRMRRRGFSSADAWLYAWLCVVGKFAGILGQGRYWMGRVFSRPAKIMEYKQPVAATADL